MEYGKRYSARKRSQWDNASRVPGWIMARKELTAGAKLCFARIANFVGGQTVAWPSQETLAEELGVSTRQVRDYLRELEAHRLIETARGGRGNPTKISLITHPWEDGEKCPCLTCDAYDRKQSSANACRNSSSTQKSVDRNSSSGSDRNSSSGAYKDEPYQGNPISGGVPLTRAARLAAAYAPATPSELERLQRATEPERNAASPQNTQRPAVAAVTDFGDPPPVKQSHSPGCAIPGAAKPQTRPVEPGAGVEPSCAEASLRRQISGALFDYFGADTPRWAIDRVENTLDQYRQRGVILGIPQVAETVRRALAWWQSQPQDTARPKGLETFFIEWPRVVDEFTGAAQPKITTARTTPGARTPEMPSQYERVKLEKLWGRSIADGDREGQERYAAGIRSLYEASAWTGPALEKSVHASRDGARDWAQRFQRQDRFRPDASLTATS